MPTAVSSVVLVSEFGGDQELVAKAIVTSTLISFITLSYRFIIAYIVISKKGWETTQQQPP